jgi:hypothetical protein
VKIEWGFKKNAQAPYSVDVPDGLQAVATIEKDSKRFPDTHGWAYGNFNYDGASRRLRPRAMMPNAVMPATRGWHRRITPTRPIHPGEA